jgi:hypothetical protein
MGVDGNLHFPVLSMNRLNQARSATFSIKMFRDSVFLYFINILPFFFRSNRGLLSGTSRVTGSSPKKGVSSLLADVQGHGVPMTDEEAIMSHFDLFCNRIRQLIDVINTLAQYTKLVSFHSVYHNSVYRYTRFYIKTSFVKWRAS